MMRIWTFNIFFLTVSRRAFLAWAGVKPISVNIPTCSEEGSHPFEDLFWVVGIGSSMSTENTQFFILYLNTKCVLN